MATTQARLPSELWSSIFALSADEDIINLYGLPTVMAESAWFYTALGSYALRTPQEAMDTLLRRSYTTKRAIVSTCKRWRKLGAEFLFRCLFFDDPPRFIGACEALAGEPGLGWWVNRIHLTRMFGGYLANNLSTVQRNLVSVLGQSPNLEILVIDCPLRTAFTAVADALCTHCSATLRTLHCVVPYEALSKVIWMLASLPALVSVHIEFDAPVTEVLKLGAAHDVTINLPSIQHLSLHGCSQDFLEQATGWQFPALMRLSFDCGSSRMDQPDVLSFLSQHGSRLIFLDVNCIPPIDIPKVLVICPRLAIFTFNADWRLTESVTGPASLVAAPHLNITHIGLHGLLYAFGVGHAAAYAIREPLRSHMMRRMNDNNFLGLTKANFPKLKVIRVLSRTVLNDLNDNNGPEAGSVDRFDRWWGQSARQGIRLEDCTGAFLGTLPQLPVEEDDDDSEEEEEEESEWEQYREDYQESEEEEEGEGGFMKSANVDELKQLLDECRQMEKESDRPLGSDFPAVIGTSM